MSEQSGTSPIPREFHSEYEGRPFKTCSSCGEALDSFSHYQINKAYRNGECVFEHVFCEACRDRIYQQFSEESRRRLIEHQEQHMRPTAGSTTDCAFCGKSRDESPMKDFVITALCQEDRLMDSLMICEPCQFKTHELLSPETRDVRRRFFEDLPGVPPDWEDLIDGEPLAPPVPAIAGNADGKLLHASAASNELSGQLRDRSDLVPCLELIWGHSQGQRQVPATL